MKNAALCLAALLCAGGCATKGPAASTSLAWPAGRFELAANITYDNRGSSQTDRFTADLEIGSDGSLTLNSSSGLCVEPSALRKDSDRERGERTFECGDVRYVLRPAGSRVIGQVTTSVQVQEVISTCVEYATDKDGNRVCMRTEEHTEMRTMIKQAPVDSRRVS
jgi:hypothetical protein